MNQEHTGKTLTWCDLPASNEKLVQEQGMHFVSTEGQTVFCKDMTLHRI